MLTFNKREKHEKNFVDYNWTTEIYNEKKHGNIEFVNTIFKLIILIP